jgi:hypothetical protein
MALVKKCVCILFLVLTLIACSWALLHTGMFRIHDFTHAARIAELLRALQDGQFPVRWSSNFGFGFGMPLFEFYAPLPFYLGALFYWLGLGLVPTVKLLFLLCSLFTFIGVYKLGARLFGGAGGLLAAVAVTMAPYRAVNLFVRGAVGEAWGMMAIPWVLLGIVRMIRGEKNGWVTLSLSLVVLFLSHNITTLLFLPISLVFGLGYWWVERMRKQKLLYTKLHQKVEDRKIIRSPADVVRIFPIYLGIVYVLAIGLAAFYLFPAFMEKDFTKVNAIFEGYFHYSNHFLYLRQFITPYWGYGGSQPGPQDGFSFFVGEGQLLGVFITVLLAIKILAETFIRSGVSKMRQLVFSWKIFLLLLLAGEMILAGFMTLEKSAWIWNHLSFMTVVQFPWRWLSVMATFLGLVVGASTLFISSRFHRYLYVLFLSVLIIATTRTYFQPENFDDVSAGFYYGDPYRIRHDMSRTLNDYIPIGMKLDELSRELPPIDVPYKVGIGGADKVTLIVDKSQEKLVHTQFSQTGKIEFAVADFPGWVVLLDNQPVATERTALGNIQVTVPAGDHQVGVQFQETPVRLWSDAVSILSWIFFCGILVWLEKGRTTRVAL